MSSSYIVARDNIITELNKRRELQKELMMRLSALAEYVGVANEDYDNIILRLQETDNKINELRGKL